EPEEPVQTVALVRFQVEIPVDPPASEGMQLSILDEVTGLALNIQRFDMKTEDDTHYSVELPFPVNSVIKYRYTRKGTVPLEEHTTDGRQVRYRLFLVRAPGTVSDRVTRWTDSAFPGQTGRIQGQVKDAGTGQPLANLLITAGGAQTLTASDGSYLIEGLPPGIHNLVAYSLDGAYPVFQQEASVAAEATTPADFQIGKADLVNVTFKLNVPEKTPPGVPLRIAGNLYQLGNTFANLEGGFSTIATRMPTMAPMPDGTYALTLSLPVGVDLRYKFTLGDGFWNAEQASAGGFLTRQLIVPTEDLTINAEVYSWSDGDGNYLAFDVLAPKNTPPNETVSIQFNPYSWTEPIPMWPLGENRWVYLLYSPLKPLRTLSYRYCRNQQCNTADAENTIGYDSTGLPYDLDQPAARAQEVIPAWNWLEADTAQVPATASTEISNPTLLRGIEFVSQYHPSWQPEIPYALDDISHLSANWLVLSPTWTYTRQNPPVLEQVAGQDPLWLDTLNSITLAKRTGLQVALNPQPNFPYTSNEWWANGKRDFSWWVVWFERYRVFLLHHADLAKRTGIQALVIGGEWVTPALPNGTLLDGSPSGVPEDAASRWLDLIQEVRQHFNGTLLWAQPYQPENTEFPPFINEVDQIYLLWSAKLIDNNSGDVDQMTTEANRLLDADVKPLADQLQKPIVVAVAYPSAQGGASGCVPDPLGDCLAFDALLPQRPDIPTAELDLQEQANAYNAMLQAVAGRDWISGFVSRGYFPPAILQDKSTSIHGKPAAEILRQIFQAWQNSTP
ncbi:MAG: glycoside hydrolase family 113, partial [Anaerolineales bacterium]